MCLVSLIGALHACLLFGGWSFLQAWKRRKMQSAALDGAAAAAADAAAEAADE